MTDQFYAGADMDDWPRWMTPLRTAHEKAFLERAASDERKIRAMLERWVSELEPAVVRDRAGEIVGLTLAGIPIGEIAMIVVPVEASDGQT